MLVFTQTTSINIGADPGVEADPLFRDTIHFTSTDPQAVLPANFTFQATDGGSRSFTVTLGTTGHDTITISDLTRPTRSGVRSASASIGVVAGLAVSLHVAGFPASTLPGAPHRFTVTALDAYGNRAVDYRGLIQFSTTGGSSVSLPPAYTFTAADRGRHTFSVALPTPGSWSLTAADATRPSITGTQTGIQVAELPAGITGPSAGVRGQPLTYALTASEVGVPAGTIFTYRISWDGRGVEQTVSGPSGLTVSHAFPATGRDTIAVTVLDPAGNVSPQAATLPVAIQTVLLEPDPADPSQSALYVGGTRGSDTIVLSPANALGTTIMVRINGVAQPGPVAGNWAPTGPILVYGQAGNDRILEVANQGVKIAVPALLFAGTGNSTLSAAGSSADNILVGGKGHDLLTGGSGRDILIGGGGAAVLHAGSGDDILIGGHTAYDANPSALLAVMAEWGRTDIGYAARVQDLFGDGSGGANGPYRLDAQTVARATAINQIFGGTGSDWIWFSDALRSADRLGGYSSGEVSTLAR